MRASLSLLAVLFVCACDRDEGARFEVPSGCQPLLAGVDCLLPYPSDFFLRDDATLPSGHRVVIEGAARPYVAATGAAADPNAGRAYDGASIIPTIVALLEGPLSSQGLVGLLEAPGDTLTAASRTLLIEASSGAFIPHYVDLDPRSEDPARRAIVIHPLGPLKHRTRYIVALQGIVREDGALAATPEGFRRIRDRQTSGLEALAERFEKDLFPALETAGVRRSDLQLSFDFTTGSREHQTGDMLAIREATIAWLSQNTPEVRIIRVETDPRPEIWRTIQGTVRGPLFMDKDEPGAVITRDPDGRPIALGTTEIPFIAQIPMSVRDQATPGRTLAYGHGFFGGRNEVTEPHGRVVIDRMNAVTFAIDWAGMSRDDVFLVVDGLVNKPDQALTFVERVHQAMANWIVLYKAIDGPIRDLEAMHRDNGDLVYDHAIPSMVGISQGHILTGVLAAVHPDLERVMLHVGGGGFSHMMFRSRSFRPFLVFLADSLPSSLEQQKFVALSQTMLDRIDPAIYAPLVSEEPLSGNSPRRVLMQIGLGDVQVPNIGSFVHARALRLPLVSPAPLDIYGLEPALAPIEGSAIAVYDMGIDLSVYAEADPPTQENVVHDGLRLTDSLAEQMTTFFQTGTVVQPCEGPCDPN